MEIKAALNKPYKEKEKLDFIVKQNHNKGYEIRETETALEAWGLNAEEVAEQEKERIIDELKKQLAEIDKKSARSMRAIIAGVATEEDKEFLANLETHAEHIREQLKGE